MSSRPLRSATRRCRRRPHHAEYGDEELTVTGTYTELISARASSSTGGHQVEAAIELTAEVAALRVELRTIRDGEVTDAMALTAELDELKRKYRALAQVIAIDADLDV